MHFIKKNISLLIALAVPVAMVLFIAASIYLPGMFIQPHFNFVYSTESYQRMVEGVSSTNVMHYYLYDVSTNQNESLTLEQVQALKLDDSPTSPDGFKITYGNRGESFLFLFGGGTDYSTQYLVGNGVSKKLNIDGSVQYYNNNFRLLGWVKQ